MNSEGKDLLLSKSFWGYIIGALAMIMAHYGMQLNVTNASANIVGVIGLVMGVAGTVVRKTYIKSVAGIPLKKSTAQSTPPAQG